MKLKHGANQANEHVLLTKHTNPNNEIMTGRVTDTKHCYLKLVECFEIPKGRSNVDVNLHNLQKEHPLPLKLCLVCISKIRQLLYCKLTKDDKSSRSGGCTGAGQDSQS